VADVDDTMTNTPTMINTPPHKPELRIALLTPYLYESVETFDPENLEWQMQKCRYNPNNLHDVKFLETDKYLLRVENPQEHSTERPEDCHFVISGCTKGGEKDIFQMKSSGTLVGRYSVFYGKPSGYTNIKPEDAGYAFDIPKDMGTIKALLRSDLLLESILEREEAKIRLAIDILNQEAAMPILVTPYLSEALKIQPVWKTGTRPPEAHPVSQIFNYVDLFFRANGAELERQVSE
jgi:hypothetical protein